MTGPASSIVMVVTAYTVLVLWPPLQLPVLGEIVFFASHWVNELPGLVLLLLVVVAIPPLAAGAPADAFDIVLLGLAAVSVVGLVEVARRGAAERRVVEEAVIRDLGGGAWPDRIRREATFPRLLRDLVLPLQIRLPRIARTRNISYGPAGKRHRLDLYRRRDAATARPVFVHFHGGRFVMGGKSREARALLFRLADEGWVSISATYRLRDAGRFPHSLTDAKRVICWVRAHAADYGIDPSLIVVSGSSAGAHLAAMVALTPNVAQFQPGFEAADASVSAAVCLYGYYGSRETTDAEASSPAGWVSETAPPFLIAHGAHDPLIPAAHAEAFTDRLRAKSVQPVVMVRLRYAEHSFDLFRSPRFTAVIDGVIAFGTWLRAHRA